MKVRQFFVVFVRSKDIRNSLSIIICFFVLSLFRPLFGAYWKFSSHTYVCFIIIRFALLYGLAIATADDRILHVSLFLYGYQVQYRISYFGLIENTHEKMNTKNPRTYIIDYTMSKWVSLSVWLIICLLHNVPALAKQNTARKKNKNKNESEFFAL